MPETKSSTLAARCSEIREVQRDSLSALTRINGSIVSAACDEAKDLPETLLNNLSGFIQAVYVDAVEIRDALLKVESRL